MYNYVYRLEHIETKEFYIGSRTSKLHPSLDVYLGSMKTWKPDKTKLKKIILKDDFETRIDAVLYESKEIKKNIDDVLNKNYHIPTEGFHTTGFVTVKTKDGKHLSVSVNDEKYLSGEYVFVRVGMSASKIWVKDELGNKILIFKDDPNFISGKYKSIMKDFRHSEEMKKKLKTLNIRYGKKNSQYGTVWVCNLQLKQNKKINKGEEIPTGWIFGKRQKHWN